MPDKLTLPGVVTDLDGKIAEVSIKGVEPAAVIENDRVAAEKQIAGKDHPTIIGRHHRCTRTRPKIGA
ncbi:MAG: hypothetical protein R3231_02325 [bacterium]|nr:hypothetical protein [bacterium]